MKIKTWIIIGLLAMNVFGMDLLGYVSKAIAAIPEMPIIKTNPKVMAIIVPSASFFVGVCLIAFAWQVACCFVKRRIDNDEVPLRGVFRMIGMVVSAILFIICLVSFIVDLRMVYIG